MAGLVRESVESLAAYTPGEQPRDPRVIKLNTNENPYPPSPCVAEALSGIDADGLRRYPDPLSLRLRERIADLHGVGAERVFVGNGSDEVLALCTRAFVEDDGTIGYFEPSYSLCPVLAGIRAVEERPVELGTDFEWRMPRGYACSLFFLTNPNAPTGILYPFETVREFCAAMPGVVVIDEAYVDFSSRHCMELAAELDNVIVARTLSKSYSLAGLRVGYAVGSERLVEALFKVKDSYNLDAVAQELALAALSDPEHMQANAGRIRATRGRLMEALAGSGYSVYPSETNFVWAKPPALPAEEVFRRLRKKGILVRYFAGERVGECLRITVGTDAEIDALIDALGEEERISQRR